MKSQDRKLDIGCRFLCQEENLRPEKGLSWWLAIGLVLTALLIQGCTSVYEHSPRLSEAGIVRQGTVDQDLKRLEKLYDLAIYDAAVFRQKHQVDNLKKVTGTTTMVSFISCFHCQECKLASSAAHPRDVDACNRCSSKCIDKNETGIQSFTSDIWVSRLDDINAHCREFPSGLSPEQLVLRLQQLLGLPPVLSQPPDSWKFLLLEIDQPAKQLFRPCTNPFPGTSGPCREEFPEQTRADHKSWMAEQAFYAWQIPGGYPWTRLGYTYNWNPEAANIVGTSEFVIPAGTDVNATSIVPAIEYCTQIRNRQ